MSSYAVDLERVRWWAEHRSLLATRTGRALNAIHGLLASAERRHSQDVNLLKLTDKQLETERLLKTGCEWALELIYQRAKSDGFERVVAALEDRVSRKLPAQQSIKSLLRHHDHKAECSLLRVLKHVDKHFKRGAQ